MTPTLQFLWPLLSYSMAYQSPALPFHQLAKMCKAVDPEDELHTDISWTKHLPHGVTDNDKRGTVVVNDSGNLVEVGGVHLLALSASIPVVELTIIVQIDGMTHQ